MKLLDFVNRDHKIHNRNHLDQYLLELCNKIIEGQQSDPEMYGMVAACVLDPDHNQTSSTSTKEDGKWKHAERNAIDAYESKYGEIPEGSIIITTLSPCDGPMSDRYEGSCTDLINHSPVKKVYCGYMDPSQHNENFEFTVENTGNKDIQRLCKKFANTFLGDKDHPVKECGGTGVIASKAQSKDPRYSMSLTRDVRPGQVEKNLKAFSLAEVEQRLDPKCWAGKKIGNPKTKIKGGIRVNNCVPAEESLEEQFDMIESMIEYWAKQHGVDSDTIWEDIEEVEDEYLLSEAEVWQTKKGKNKNGGLNKKGVASYRRTHPGSKLQTAVTTKPGKLKKGSKASKRRKSFCARMKGMKNHRTSNKTAHDPNSRINKSLRKWHCE